MTGFALFLAVFLACAVEAVEATTIVLAAGISRDWKSALLGTASALGLLGAIIAIFGPAISSLPINSLRIFVGTLLLVFGLQWIRKAILRSSGFKELHDEDQIFKEEVAAAKSVQSQNRLGEADWYAFTLSFKGVLLEGLEVAFIVLTFGSVQNDIGLASIAALSAVAIVIIAGALLRTPLSRVPENSMKFTVGIMLTAFGIFWGAEGAGAQWPGDDLSILGIIAFLVALSYGFITWLRSRKATLAIPAKAAPDFDEADSVAVLQERGWISSLKAFGYFWYDFLIGDDLTGTLMIVIALEGTNLAFHSGANAWYVLPVVVALTLFRNLWVTTQSKQAQLEKL
ncbi:unannotated protein [freshwater metagenome]|uniref:Unannotated protein n=1 Tax=freshwater metagenome TaxID=449393 RepID=A0A6J7G334_9ZZZZ